VNGVKSVSGYGDKRARPRLRDLKFAPALIFLPQTRQMARGFGQ